MIAVDSYYGEPVPRKQTAALIRSQEHPIKLEFNSSYPVPEPGSNEVLVKVLYTGVCQSDLHTAAGTATGADGLPITKIKFPHVGGHEGVGRIVKFGPACDQDNPKVVGPVLCAGVTAYRAVLNANLKHGSTLVVFGAGGGLGHLAVQYGLAMGARVIGVDTGSAKRDFIKSAGADFVDFAESADVVNDVRYLSGGDGAAAAIVTSGHPKAFSFATCVLGIGGTLCCIGIPPGEVTLPTPIATIVIKGLKIVGNLVGSMQDTIEALEFVRKGLVNPRVEVRPFRDLPQIYSRLEKGDILGRVVLQVAEDVEDSE